MSEMSQGPGYWQASDGLWYPPESHPDYQPPQAQPAVPAQAPASPPGLVDTSGRPPVTYSGPGYPVRYAVSPNNKIARWRALVQPFMAIPQYVVAYVLMLAGYVTAIISWFAILFTGKHPVELHAFQTLSLRYATRTFSYIGFLTEEYPPFEFETELRDPTNYPVQLSVDPSPPERNRVTVFFRLFMALPHFFVLAIIGIAVYFSYIVVWFAILFTGRFPEGLRNFVVGFAGWYTRALGYYMLLTDEYPPFSMD